MSKITPAERMLENYILKMLDIPRPWGDFLRISTLRKECEVLGHPDSVFNAALTRLRNRHLVESAGWGTVRLVRPEVPKPEPKKYYVISLQVVLMEDDEFLDVIETVDLPTTYSSMESALMAFQDIVSSQQAVFLPCGEPSYLGQE